MRKMHVVLAVLFVFVALIGVGCGSNSPFDPEETIIFENRTGLNGMSCFVDGVLKGAVNNGQDLKVEGDYEGDRVLSATVDGLATSRIQHVDNGMTFYYSITR